MSLLLGWECALYAVELID